MIASLEVCKYGINGVALDACRALETEVKCHVSGRIQSGSILKCSENWRQAKYEEVVDGVIASQAIVILSVIGVINKNDYLMTRSSKAVLFNLALACQPSTDKDSMKSKKGVAFYKVIFGLVEQMKASIQREKKAMEEEGQNSTVRWISASEAERLSSGHHELASFKPMLTGRPAKSRKH